MFCSISNYQSKWNRTLIGLMGVLLVIISVSCVKNADSPCRNDVPVPCIPEGEPFERLSEYRLFRGELKELHPVDALIPYDLNTPLFSDYAQKFRLIYVPSGSTVRYQDTTSLDFPEGSVIVKNFYYDLNWQSDESERRILETRLLMRRMEGWTAEVYVWNQAQTEAFRTATGDLKEVEWVDARGISRQVKYLIPTKNDCKTCHSLNGSIIPIGPKVRNLNKLYTYSGGPQNQLIRWEQAGILIEKPSSDVPAAPVWDDSTTGSLTERARIYLDVNCAHCHNRGGSANNTGLLLNFEQTDPFRLGICKSPVAIGPASGGFRYDINPCKPEQSIMVYRMNAVQPQVRMPELGRTLIHEEAVKLIKEWIERMPCQTCKQ